MGRLLEELGRLLDEVIASLFANWVGELIGASGVGVVLAIAAALHFRKSPYLAPFVLGAIPAIIIFLGERIGSAAWQALDKPSLALEIGNADESIWGNTKWQKFDVVNNTSSEKECRAYLLAATKRGVSGSVV